MTRGISSGVGKIQEGRVGGRGGSEVVFSFRIALCVVHHVHFFSFMKRSSYQFLWFSSTKVRESVVGKKAGSAERGKGWVMGESAFVIMLIPSPLRQLQKKETDVCLGNRSTPVCRGIKILEY